MDDIMSKADSVLVSVVMTTYNHEKYIDKAINGVLMQKCNFNVELIISNDCSTDNTNTVITNIVEQYQGPIIIRYENQVNNLGYARNLSSCFRMCQGKYIAICEGDDYWIDEYKLQKQVDIFNANAEIGLVYSPVKLLDNDTLTITGESNKYVVNRDEVIPELLKSKYIEFCSIMFRADKLFDALDILKDDFNDRTMLMGDTRLVLEVARNSQLGFVKEATAVYRIVSGSISHTTNVKKFLFAVNDTYKLRENFVLRYNLDKKMMGIPLCHYNRALIFKMYSLKNLGNVWGIARGLKIKEYFTYCSFKTFSQKMTLKVFALLFLSLIGFGCVKNAIKP